MVQQFPTRILFAVGGVVINFVFPFFGPIGKSMRSPILAVLFCCMLSLIPRASAAAPAGGTNARGTHNDGIYPPSDAAKPFIDFDNKGFIVNGKHVFLASGSIHYARVPHEMWTDRLLRLKQANFNVVQSYVFWNYQEPVEGQYNTSADADFGAFLDAAQKVGLYATVRPGPYVCAEWDSGGYPVWLRFVPNLSAIRGDNPAWLALNDHWYDYIIPIIARHQINHGGNVILVQLENEHPHGWGVLPDNPYFVHLHDVAVKDGLEVPHFMSGMHHGGSPSPDNLDPGKRTTPWYSTEFWAGWFDDYRTLNPRKVRQIIAANWGIVGHGGAGMNYYMAHGGSNFDAWSDDSTGASYDYGAAIGQTGDLRPIYYQMKRANQIAMSFPDIISNSSDAMAPYQDFVIGKNVSVNGARQSDAGTIVFLQNRSGGDSLATFKSGETLHLTRYGNYPLPQNAVIDPGVKIVDTTVPILGVAHNDHVVTVIVYEQPGDVGRLTLSTRGNVTAGKSDAAFTTDLSHPDHLDIKIKFPASGVEECDLYQPNQQIRVLAINQDLSLYTWILGPADRQDVLFGPDYVQEVRHSAEGKMEAVIERPYGRASCGQVAIYSGKDQSSHLAAPADTRIESQPAPELTHWQMSPAAEASATFDDSQWKQSELPLPMGADTDYGAFAWYRTTIDLPKAGSGILKLKGADNLEAYVNGEHADAEGGVWSASFVAGKNVIAVFASHKGRKKLFGYLGPLDDIDVKGLVGTPQLNIDGQTLELKGWRMKGGLGVNVSDIASWSPPVNTQGIPAFYRSSFIAKPPGELGAHPILRVNYRGLVRGMIWVNGHSLGRYPEKIRIDSLYIPECWLNEDGKNALTIFDETGASPDQVGLVVEVPASREVILASEPIDPATPIVVPAENKSIDLIALNKGNVAFGCRAVATYSRSSGGAPVMVRDAAAITDGDPDTTWEPPNPRTLASASAIVDLGKSMMIKTCEVVFENAANGYKYVLEGSTDGQSWTRLGDQTTAVPTSPDSPSELARINLKGDTCRYLRVTIHGGRNFAIAEVRAFGNAR
jgi:beta-galactosidase